MAPKRGRYATRSADQIRNLSEQENAQASFQETQSVGSSTRRLRDDSSVRRNLEAANRLVEQQTRLIEQQNILLQ